MLELIITKHIQESISTKTAILNDAKILNELNRIANYCVNSLKLGGKILFCGNGGSAADAQHLAAELSGRYKLDRKPLYAEALHTNSSYVTAVANDYSYDIIYERMVEAIGKPHDILILLSTSGKSINIIKAAKKARELKLKVVGFTGNTNNTLHEYTNALITVPSNNTPIIQESHIMLGHILCDLIEQQTYKLK